MKIELIENKVYFNNGFEKKEIHHRAIYPVIIKLFLGYQSQKNLAGLKIDLLM